MLLRLASRAVLLLAACAIAAAGAGRPAETAGPAAAAAVPSAGTRTADDAPAAAPRPMNVVLVLADDLDWAVFRNVERLDSLRAEGTTFLNHSVTDSLCCPSRASILRGQYVHNHGVVSNVEATGGGWAAFRDRGLDEDCLPVWLDDAGVESALVGKFLNEYPGEGEQRLVPPGWSHWVVPVTQGAAYRGRDYVLNVDGSLAEKSDAFLEDALAERAARLIDTGELKAPFMLLYSSYLPHDPAPVAPRHRGSHAGARLPASASLNRVPTAAPRWLSAVPRLSRKDIRDLDRRWAKRLASAEALADSIASIRRALARSGHLRDTVIVVTSDNGYHLGSHGLPRGKRTAFDEDTVVPLVMIGPGIKRGATVSALTSAVDLAPTVAGLSGAAVPAWVDGRSLQPLLQDPRPKDWRGAVLSEAFSQSTPGDPDYFRFAPPPFVSWRTERWLLVRYLSGEVELYDRLLDPGQLVNVAGTVPADWLDRMVREADAARGCAGSDCWLPSGR